MMFQVTTSLQPISFSRAKDSREHPHLVYMSRRALLTQTALSSSPTLAAHACTWRPKSRAPATVQALSTLETRHPHLIEGHLPPLRGQLPEHRQCFEAHLVPGETNEDRVPRRRAPARHFIEHLPGRLHVPALGVRVDHPGVDEHVAGRYDLGRARVDLASAERLEAGACGEHGRDDMGIGAELAARAREEGEREGRMRPREGGDEDGVGVEVGAG